MTQDNEFDPNDMDNGDLDNEVGDEQYDRDSVGDGVDDGEIIADANGVLANGAVGVNGSGDDFDSPTFGIGSVQGVGLERVMRTAYLNYAMSVIVSRALPDARDGLKPVHRRILYAMYDLNMGPTTAYKKSARIVGEVLGKYHPHGDSSVYDAMARMAQDFSLRYLLVDGQGNFGSVDGDAPAAMRYTEARLHRHAEALLQDLDMDTVDWQPNFDDSLREPTVMPAMLPNFLLNGTSGIAVGMATNVPPHNLREIADGIAFVIDNWDRRDAIETAELMNFVKGPDFPTGGIILGTEGIGRAFATGQGRIVVRARAEVDETKNNARIIIREIPYQVNKSTLIEKIAELAREGRVEGIRDLRDESDRRGMRIVIEIKNNASALPVLNQLYKSTSLQSSFSVNTLALVKGQPKIISLRAAIIIYIEHREEVITRRTEFQLGKARERAHILEGLRIALEFLDEVIRLIRASDSAEAARTALMSRFGLSQVQAQAILDMQLRRLANLERQRIEDEYQELLGKINFYLDLLANPAKIRAIVREDILMLKEKFGDARRTEIDIFGDENIDITKLVPLKTVMVMISKDSSIKCVPVEEFRKTGRGAVGIKGAELRKDDLVGAMVTARTHDTVLFFTDRGRVFSTPVYKLPQANRTQKGQHINQYLNLTAGERVTAMIPVSDFTVADFITLITHKGTIKRMYLDLFANVRPSGIIAMSLEDGDSLDWARLTNGSQDFIVTTRGGKASRFDENTVRPMGRGAFGVNGMKLRDDDSIVSLEVVREDGELLVISEKGYGKRVNLKEFTAKGRNIQGNWVTDHTKLEETGPIVAARVVHPNDQITVITANGSVARMNVDTISSIGRMTKGVIIQKLRPGDAVAALAVVKAEEIGDDDEEVEVTPGVDLALDGNSEEPGELEALLERAGESPEDEITAEGVTESTAESENTDD